MFRIQWKLHPNWPLYWYFVADEIDAIVDCEIARRQGIHAKYFALPCYA